MRFAERAAVSLVRPIYRSFVERPLWWFLARVKAFFFAEIGAETTEALARLTDIERRLQVIEGQLQATERNNGAQWDALEQLLLAVLRQPASLHESEVDTDQWLPAAASTEVKLNGANESNSLR